jgi:hypothetical protein
MTYNPNIPQSGDFLSVSQGDLLTNFSQVDTLFGQDHEKFSAGSNQGKHNQSTYLEQSSPPSTLANEGAVYTKDISGATQLFFRDESNGSEHQVTGIVPGQTGTNYGTDLSDGLQWRFGQILHKGQSTKITFQTPFTTDVYACLITPIGSLVIRQPNVQLLDKNQFFLRTITNSPSTGELAYYLAIGR